jgi:succinate dehydrogenase/fumarate reductase-like Fe-S protein
MKLAFEHDKKLKEEGNTALIAKDMEIAQMKRDLDATNKLVLNLKPVLDNMEEIKEFLQERAWQKEQKARVEADQEEQEERREISKSEKL